MEKKDLANVLADLKKAKMIVGFAPALCFRLETWSAGNGYVGSDAANDNEWIDRVYKVLQENWPNPKSTYIDVF